MVPWSEHAPHVRVFKLGTGEGVTGAGEKSSLVICVRLGV